MSREREIISVKKLKKLIQKKEPVFLAVIWGQEKKTVNAAMKAESLGLTKGKKARPNEEDRPKEEFCQCKGA